MDWNDKESFDDQSGSEISSEMENIFKIIRYKFKRFNYFKRDKLYFKAKRIFMLLSNSSRSNFEFKIKRFSELWINDRDDFCILAKIVEEMISKFTEEYPKFTSNSVKQQLNKWIEERDVCIKAGNQIAQDFNIKGYKNIVESEIKRRIEENDFYRKSDEYIKKIDENGRNLLLRILEL